MREDFDTANEVLPAIPKESRARVAHFLEKQGFKKQALAVTTDPEHQFDLALQVKIHNMILSISTTFPQTSTVLPWTAKDLLNFRMMTEA